MVQPPHQKPATLTVKLKNMKSHFNLYNRLKVAFIMKILMRSTYPQIDEPNFFHELNILNWIKKGTEISLEIQNVLTLDSSENCKGKNTALGSIRNYQNPKISRPRK